MNTQMENAMETTPSMCGYGLNCCACPHGSKVGEHKDPAWFSTSSSRHKLYKDAPDLYW